MDSVARFVVHIQNALSRPRFNAAGMTPFQGYERVSRYETQGSAALHPGLSSDARSGLRMAATRPYRDAFANASEAFSRAQPADPEGVVLDLAP